MNLMDRYELVYEPKYRSYRLLDFANTPEGAEARAVVQISKELLVQLILKTQEVHVG